MKALIDTSSDRILGFTVFVGEIIATVQVALMAGLPYTALRDAIFTHPTMLEGLASFFYKSAARLSPGSPTTG
jgi:pyruvate/2-oxoglutarate dehydrogenase complex dihydrolipoamide dehydrogenase (E3) component